jgi:hypothetical protein
MKGLQGLLLTLLTPTAFAQYQAPVVPLDAPPVAAPIEALPSNAGALPAFEYGIDAGVPLSPLEATPLTGSAQGLRGLELPAAPAPARAALAPRSVDGAAPLSRLESLSAPAPRGAELGSVHSAFFDLNVSRTELQHGLGAAEVDAGALQPVALPAGPAAEQLGRRHPRVVVVVDVFQKKAADSTIRLIDILQQKGVQIVFVTNRPDRGADSVDEVLTSRLKARRDHPILVVSSSGAKIYKHASRAANPKPTIPNAQSFTEEEWQSIDQAVLSVAAQKRLSGISVPHRPERDAYLYEAELPQKANVEAFVASVNAKLRSAGVPYKAEAQAHVLTIRAYKPHMAFPRITEALNGLLHRNAFENADEIQVFADSKKSASLLRAFPKNVYIDDTKDEQALASSLGAMLGADSLENRSVFRSKIRSYLEYLRRKAPKLGGGGSFGGWGEWKDQPQELKFYRGVIMHELMGRLYRDMRNGEYHLATLEQAIARLNSMWQNPRRHYVRLPNVLAKTAGSEAWRQKHRKSFNSAKANAVAWLRNYYARKFPSYPDGLLEEVTQNVANLSSDGKSLITVELRSPYTGRRYLIHVRPDRAEVRRGMEGPELIASVYRFGKEKVGAYDETESKLLAMALLKGYTRKDGANYILNGRPVKKVTVQFEYITRTVPYTHDVNDLPKYESEMISLIERMEADPVFQREYEKEQEKEAPRKARKPAKKPAAKRTSRGSR